MTVLHVALFRWLPETTDAQVVAFDEALSHMPAAVPFLRNLRHGRDLGVELGNLDYAVVAELDSIDEVPAYLEHPAHKELFEKHVSRILDERRAVQFAISAGIPSENDIATGRKLQSKVRKEASHDIEPVTR